MGSNIPGWGAESFGTWAEGEQAGEGGTAGAKGHEEEIPQGENAFFGNNRRFFYQVSREGDFLVFVEKKGLLTTQNGTQQITERRVRLGGTDLNTLEELGFWDK